ncbi:MAG: hypothetical protein LBT88_04760 [Oscillospiraceae bacterium]|jgi:hypothetical protein|nr:hypothetical protein [Oscillospiraceae bacterium]
MTAENIFESALKLMDAVEDAAEYSARASGILRVLLPELQRAAGTEDTLLDVSELSYTVDLPEQLLDGVAPYGLAAHLLLEENPALASFFQARYEEGLARFERRRLAKWESISNVYGGIEFSSFSRWT